ncbi:MAG TPA: ribonuclease H-like domain-containing protein [Candidatus Sulfotelmatobacter sp.]|nr:ribonuclease H-like domain-containing protein [Candidatus Sulfotelmatobacter sp.]
MLSGFEARRPGPAQASHHPCHEMWHNCIRRLPLAGLFDREIYLDVETLKLSHEVQGGWSNIRAFGLAVAVTWDKESGFRRWYEEAAAELINELERFTHVVTFNGNRFDLEVLRAYAPVDRLRKLSFDVHELLYAQLGHRVKLDKLARETLGTAKSGDGLQAVGWWRAGQKDRVAEYCEQDVAILRDLVAYGREKGYVIVSSRQVRVPWE